MKLLMHTTLRKKLIRLKVLLVLGGLLFSNLSFGQTCDISSTGSVDFTVAFPIGTVASSDVLCIENGHTLTVNGFDNYTSRTGLTIVIKNGGTLDVSGFFAVLQLDATSTIIVQTGGTINGGFFGGITIGGAPAYSPALLGDPNTVTGPTVIAPGGPAPIVALFSIASGDWDDGQSWSGSSGGISCGCTPTATLDVTIEAHTIDLLIASESADLTIQSGGTLRWTANATLTIRNTSDLTVDAGGTINNNGNNVNIAFDNSLGAGTSTLTNNGSINIRNFLINGTDPVLITNNGTFTLSLHLDINGTSNVTIEGSSDINITRNIRFDAINILVTNNLTGNLNIRDVFFNGTGGTFQNNGTISARDVRVQGPTDDNNLFTNNSSLVLSRNIDTNNADFTLDNNGTINQTGIFTRIVGASAFNNNSGTSWSYGGATFDADVRLFCDNGSNTFTYNNAGIQNIISPQDAYYHLTIAGTGDKTLLGDIQINGDLDMSANTGFIPNTFRVTFGGSDGLQTITGAGNFTTAPFDNLTINNTSGVVPAVLFTNIFGGAVTTNLTLTSGIVDVESTTAGFAFGTGSTLTLNSGGLAGSFIDGPILRQGSTDFIFPTGDVTGGVGKWARLGISNLSSSETYTAKYNEVVYSDVSVSGMSHVSGYEHWTLTRAGTETAAVTLYWEDGSPTGSDITDIGPTDLVVASYDGADWVSEGQVTPIPGSTAVGNVTSAANVAANYSVFTFGSLTGINPLPIELALFEGKQENTLVLLDWETASELNNDFFTLRRSYDGNEFEIIATIEGAGNSNKALSYSFEDLPAKSGVIYYQLTQTDFDGTSETFDIIGVRYESSSDLIQVYPNPLSGNELTVLLPGEVKGKVVVNIYSLTGEIIYQQEFIDPDNKLIVKLDNRRSKGMYLLKIITETGGFTSKLYLE